MNESFTDFKDVIARDAFVTGAQTRIIDKDEQTRAKWLFDFRNVLLRPELLNRYAEIFWQLYASRYPFQVCGMESAAISLVSAIVMKSVERGTPVNGLYIRKSRKRQGMMKRIEGSPTPDPIILIDDLINSGGTFDKQLKVLADAGLHVAEILAILAFRNMPAYEALGVPMRALFTLEDFGIPLLTSKSPEVVHHSFDVVWKFQAPNPSYNYVVPKSAPVIDDEKIYFGSDAGIFYALDQKMGSIVWNFKVGKHPAEKGIFSSPVLHEGVVYFGAYDGNVYALDTKSGNELWRYDRADWVGSSPAISENLGLLFIGLEFGLFRKRGGIAALDLSTGKEVWSDRTPELTHCSPLYIEDENMVVIGSNDARVYAYRAGTGEALWRFEADGDVKASFAYDKKTRMIFFGTLGGTFYALSLDGSVVYAKEIGPVYSIPCVKGDSIYVSSLDKHIYALDIATGKDRWSYATSGRIFASPVIIENSLWCGSNDGRLYEIDSENGKLKRYFQVSERIVNKITYNQVPKYFFVPTQANEMYCIFVRK